MSIRHAKGKCARKLYAWVGDGWHNVSAERGGGAGYEKEERTTPNPASASNCVRQSSTCSASRGLPYCTGTTFSIFNVSCGRLHLRGFHCNLSLNHGQARRQSIKIAWRMPHLDIANMGIMVSDCGRRLLLALVLTPSLFEVNLGEQS